MKGTGVETWRPIRKLCPLFRWEMRRASPGKWPWRRREVGESSYILETEPTNSTDWDMPHLRREIRVFYFTKDNQLKEHDFSNHAWDLRLFRDRAETSFIFSTSEFSPLFKQM